MEWRWDIVSSNSNSHSHSETALQTYMTGWWWQKGRWRKATFPIHIMPCHAMIMWLYIEFWNISPLRSQNKFVPLDWIRLHSSSLYLYTVYYCHRKDIILPRRTHVELFRQLFYDIVSHKNGCSEVLSICSERMESTNLPVELLPSILGFGIVYPWKMHCTRI